jgi:hypothetical protein
VQLDRGRQGPHGIALCAAQVRELHGVLAQRADQFLRQGDRQHRDRRCDAAPVQLAAERDLALGDIAGQIGNRIRSAAHQRQPARRVADRLAHALQPAQHRQILDRVEVRDPGAQAGLACVQHKACEGRGHGRADLWALLPLRLSHLPPCAAGNREKRKAEAGRGNMILVNPPLCPVPVAYR